MSWGTTSATTATAVPTSRAASPPSLPTRERAYSAITLRVVGQADRASDREHSVVDEHDRDAIGGEHAREAVRRALEQGLRIALRAHDLLELGRCLRPRLELGRGALHPPERVLLDQ